MRHFGEYPPDWKAIAFAAKERAGWRCERCGHPDEPPWKLLSNPDDKTLKQVQHASDRIREWFRRRGLNPYHQANGGWGPRACTWRCTHLQDGETPKQRMLTVHHLDLNKANCADWNLAALCQGCHLTIQGRVDFHKDYAFEHTLWMVPHVEGRDAARLAGTWPA